ncbi:MAG: fluoroacetyl-CoA thioesterase [Marivirga sp.]|jgi:fluoroacetyl-CoA thioesterase
MRIIFSKGDLKYHQFTVEEGDFATFTSEAVHQVCSTFALAREIEWSTRLFVKDMLAYDEEGIGTKLNISHVGPAVAGDTVEIIAIFEGITDQEVICSYAAKVGERIVAMGETGQKIIPKEKLQRIFDNLK